MHRTHDLAGQIENVRRGGDLEGRKGQRQRKQKTPTATGGESPRQRHVGFKQSLATGFFSGYRGGTHAGHLLA